MCDICRNPTEHNNGCPVENLANQPQYDKGYAYGFADNHIEWWNYKHYTPSFLLGWRNGKSEIDRLVDDAAQSRY